MPFITAIIAGVSRALVGAGRVSRGIAYPVVYALLVAVLYADFSWWAFGIAAVPIATMWAGYTDWFDRWYMLVRYGAPVLAVSIAVSYLGGDQVVAMWWPLCAALAGLLYGDMKKTFQYLMWPDQLPELVAGAVIIGGAAFL
jgi:hypothetical protein